MKKKDIGISNLALKQFERDFKHLAIALYQESFERLKFNRNTSHKIVFMTVSVLQTL